MASVMPWLEETLRKMRDAPSIPVQCTHVVHPRQYDDAKRLFLSDPDATYMAGCANCFAVIDLVAVICTEQDLLDRIAQGDLL